VIRFTPLLIDAARPCRHRVGDRWHVDETYVKIAGEWRYVYRAVDQHGQVIDIFVSPRRDAPAAKKFFAQALKATGSKPAEVVTDKASTYPGVLDEVLPGAFHNTVKHANNAIENDHGRLRARLRPMRGTQTGPLCPDRHRRPRPDPEPATGSLRTRRRCPATPAP
jgi:transposase-like protein